MIQIGTKFIVTLGILGCVFSTFSQTNSLKVIQHEDMFLMKRVGKPILTPDGKTAIFSVTEPAYDPKNVVSDLYIVATDGQTPPKRFTGNKGAETAYELSLDGKTLAFTAKRDADEESQVYLLPMQGGEAQRLSNCSTGANGPKWSPNGKMILFGSKQYPFCYTDSLQVAKAKAIKDQKYKVRVFEGFPIQDFDRWIDERVEMLFVQHTDSAKAINISKFIVGDKKHFKVNDALWASDSTLVFTASTNSHQAAYKYPDYQLYSYNINNNKLLKLSSDSLLSYSLGTFSANRKYLYTITHKVDQQAVYSAEKLMRYDWPSMTNGLNVTKNLDRPINSYVVTQNGVILSVENAGRDYLLEIDNNGTYNTVSTTEKGCYTQPMFAENTLVALYGTTTSPAELVAIKSNKQVVALTKLNEAKLKTLDLPEPITFYTKSSRGKNIRSMLLKPAQFDASKKYPLLVLMHGGPASSFKEVWGGTWNASVHAQNDLVILMTDYTGSTGYGEKFSQDIKLDPFKGPATEIQEAAADAIKRFSFIDGSKQVCGGASYGGHLANWMQATTTHYKALVSHAGLVNSISQWGTSDFIYGRELMNGGAPWDPKATTWKDQNPIMYAKNFKTPMLITVGERDFRVPMNNSIESWHIHQRLQIPSKLLVFPDENHWILNGENSRFMYKEVMAWWRKYLK
jgi:dipeptidyl aminopeptidase/acylaminoacyl peptidase